ncbi:MAG: NADH:flavin oxidoreductase/NADH oxidase, partial [Dokdonella sp.]
SLTLRNRIAVSPMCEYSAIDGVPQAWHLVHLGSRAVGGAALVMAEACAVSAEGRISPADAGIWNDTQAAAWAPITRFIRDHGAVPGIQLAHAGRKASTTAPWLGGGPISADSPERWLPVAPSPLAFDSGYACPHELDRNGLDHVIACFRSSAQRALDAGFELVEIHAAHGYLLHEFLSSLSNQRGDDYGGSFANRVRLLVEVVAAVRSVWPERLPLFVRISATDWADGGWEIEQSIALSRLLACEAVDLIDVSSGGLVPHVRIPTAPGYQVPFAARIRREVGIATGAVGLITEAKQAKSIIADGDADIVLLAREMLRDPYWPRRAARELGVEPPTPKQYMRAW